MNAFRSSVVVGAVVMAAALGGFAVGRGGRTAAPSERRQSLRRAAAPSPLGPAVHGPSDYRAFAALPATPRRDQSLAALLEDIARTDPMAGMALALAEDNLKRRDLLVEAVLRGWAKRSAKDAAAWVIQHSDGSPRTESLLCCVLSSAAEASGDAQSIARSLMAADPAGTREYGDALIYALGQAGRFDAAARFASVEPGGFSVEWLSAAYANWANAQPAEAAASAQALADPGARAAALDAALATWSTVDPKGLAQFAMDNLAAGEVRTRTLGNALLQWSARDLPAASAWINTYNPGPELDMGEAAVATNPVVMAKPEIALGWADAISDAALRSRTAASIAESWYLTDPQAALAFARNGPQIQDSDRQPLLQRLSSLR